MNANLQIAKKRSILTQKIRDFFVQNNFLEVETPIMTRIPGMEPHLTPFETKLIPPANLGLNQGSITQLNNMPLYLNTSPELQMKKLLGASFGNIFQITKVFRNCEMNSPLHNPEFTMLEWYRENADYTDLMTDCENLILQLVEINRLKFTLKSEPENKAQNSQPTSRFTYQFQPIDLTPPWPRFSTNELFQKYCQINLLENQTFATFKKTAQTHNYDTKAATTWDDIYFKIFLNYIEPELNKLNTPFFIYDYPASQAALAKTCLPDKQELSKNPFFAERFELYIKGIELANAFSELIDSKEQRQRLQEEQNLRKKLHKTVFPIDEEFLQALDQIKNPCAGIAMGLDRLFMFLLDKKTIEEVLLFPFAQKQSKW